MHDIKLIRDNPQAFDAGLERRGLSPLSASLLAIDAKRRAAILAAVPGAIEIGDRRAAIAAGLNELREGDVLVVAGKGHEQGQIIGGTTIPFDDASVLRELGGAA